MRAPAIAAIGFAVAVLALALVPAVWASGTSIVGETTGAPAALPYYGPCDHINGGCAEAWSVTHAAANSYTGLLFELWNGTTLLDIGQTASRTADMTTWAAFCGGTLSAPDAYGIETSSTCFYGKIYAQIQGHANDLIPAVFNTQFGPNCSGGTAYKCAAPFAIDTGTGLPVIETTAGQEYTLVNDQSAVGINAAGTAETVIASGKPVSSLYCCGWVGTAHVYSATDVAGTDFMITLAHGQAGGNGANCGTPSSNCIGIDEELAGNPHDYSTSLIANVIGVVTYDPVANAVAGYVNNRLIYTTSPPETALNSGKSLHLGGGGDLSQPDPVIMREAMITNHAITSGEVDGVFRNLTAFYNGQSFP